MKKQTKLLLIVIYLLGSVPVLGVEMSGSLRNIIQSQGKNENALTPNDFKDLLESNVFYGDIIPAKEHRKFSALLGLCEIIEKRADKKKIAPFLLEEIAKLNFKDKEPGNWNEILIVGWKGNLGVIMHCYLNITGEEGFTILYKDFLKSNNLEKMEVLLYMTIYGRMESKYVKSIEKNKDPNSSAEMKIIIDKHLIKVAEIEKKKADEKAKNASEQ